MTTELVIVFAVIVSILIGLGVWYFMRLKRERTPARTIWT